MKETFEIKAVVRTDEGKGASRRLRLTGMVPGIVYGGGKEPAMVATTHNTLAQHLDNEAFYSHILSVKVDGKAQKVVLKDLQRHPAKPFIMHFDLLRVADTDRIKMHVPLHFMGEDVAPGIKAGGNIIHAETNIEVSCQAKDLPEYIELDVSALDIGDTLHLSDINMPKGVDILALIHGEEHDAPVVSLHAAKVISEDEDEDAAVEPEATDEEDGDDAEE